MMTQTTKNDTPEARSALSFRHVKQHLGIGCSKRLAKLIGNILSRITLGLDPVQARELVGVLPAPLQWLAVGPYHVASEQRPIRHLDELVEAVYEADRKSGAHILRTEIAALEAVVVVLRELDHRLDLFKHNFLQHRVVAGIKNW